jgi:uncharacterized secreted protein with C-terminal beta-propeller domain
MRRPLLIASVCTLAAALSACTSPVAAPPKAYPVPALELVAYKSCDTLLPDLRAAAKANVQAWGFGNYGAGPWAASDTVRGTLKAETAPEPAYSGTNNQESGVDEPDLVKTDGHRIVTMAGKRLQVVDAGRHRLAGSLTMPGAADEILLSGDHALVMGRTSRPIRQGLTDRVTAPLALPELMQTSVWLVDISGAPRILSSYAIDAAYADARQTGTVARVVVRSAPRIEFPVTVRGDGKSRIQANQKAIDKAPLDAWLPAYTSDGKASRVDCAQVSRPHTYSGTSLVTVLSFDLSRDALGDGVPTSVLADGDTVYGSGTNLYISHDERWRGQNAPAGTQIFQFDISAMQPRYAAGGTVPGWLLNQYSLSEYDGVLRVATTTGHPWFPDGKSISTVYALRNTDGDLKVVGSVGGLGKSEQIYAVRFAGPMGYVVTFRRTDPLYAVDLTDPVHPKVAGELKIPGYSAYLHPLGDGRLIGVGQNADDRGRLKGLQISLFDVSNPARPQRIATKQMGADSSSEAEFDPHAFLYWPDSHLLVVPVLYWAMEKGPQRYGVNLIHVDGTSLTDAGWITHANLGISGTPMIRRSLVIGDELWTISDAGVLASRLDTAQQIAWLPV